MILADRQCAAIDWDWFDYIRIINLFQGCADMSILPAFFPAGFGLWFLFPVRVGRRRFAAVGAA
jgi:hypothetical protein